MFQEKIYNISPYWFRNILVSLLGYKFVKQRYGKTYQKLYDFYTSIQYESKEEMLKRQQELFVDFVNFSYKNSKFYNHFYKYTPLPTNLDQITQLPLLSKEILRSNLELLKSGQVDSSLICIHTSGTTGTPMTFYYTPDDFQARMAIIDSYRGWFGIKKGDKRATFSGRIIKSPKSKSKKYWQMNYALNQRLYSTYHLSIDNLSYYISDLNSFKPLFMDGYPSALLVIAKYILSRRINISFTPKVIFTTAETLKPHDKETIEFAFGCPVKNQYASSEGAPFIVECEKGKLHFLTYSGIIETLDEKGEYAKKGQAVFTSFHTHFMPLIRYMIGDYVSFSDETSCKCGRHYPLIECIVGREEDYLISPQRGKIGRLDPIFKKLPPSIIKSQIVQNDISEVEVFYIPDQTIFNESHLVTLRHELEARLGENMKISFKQVKDIPVGKNGKFKAIICNIKDSKINL